MTELALRAVQPTQVSTSLATWAEEARQAAEVAVQLAQTPFVPASLRNQDSQITAANITAAILTGQELGLEPMAALRSIDVIQGTPALRAIALRAVVLAAGHDMWVHESTASRAIVRGQRRGSDQVQESVWTTDRARGLGLLNKDNWKKQPAAMLIARATSECARLIAADALLGVPYTVEELGDGADAVDIVVEQAEPAKPKRTAQRRSAQKPAIARPPVATEPKPAEPEPSFDEAPAGESSAPDPITDAQSKKLHALYNEVGTTDRMERLAHASGVIGRDVASSSELTKDEASRVIDALERWASGAGDEAPPEGSS